MSVVTVNVNDALSTASGISPPAAVVVGLNEEITKALPVLLAGLYLLKHRSVSLDTRMWMFIGTIAGLTFEVAEQALYTSNDILAINEAASANQAVTAVLAFAERVFVDGFQHAVWAGIAGFFIGMALNYQHGRRQLIIVGIAVPALLHALNDWAADGLGSTWGVVIIQAASLLLFLGYTMSAESIEQQVRENPIFRGDPQVTDRQDHLQEHGSGTGVVSHADLACAITDGTRVIRRLTETLQGAKPTWLPEWLPRIFETFELSS